MATTGPIAIYLLLVASIFTITKAVSVDRSYKSGKGLKIDGHTRLTSDKQQALDKLKTRVIPRLTEDFMKDDLYLLRFLQEKKFDVNKAELMILNHLQWREDNQINELHKEDWSDLEKEYPYRVDGVDKQGQPIVQLDFDKWDISTAYTDPEKRKRLDRYFEKILHEADKKVMELQSQGKNVSKWLCLANLQELNMQQHINVASSPFYWSAANSIENNHPGMSNKIISINTPGIAGTVLGIVRSAFSEKANNAFKDYGDEKEWKPVLLDLVDPDQLSPEYGGTKGTRKVGEKDSLVSTFKRTQNGWIWFPRWI